MGLLKDPHFWEILISVFLVLIAVAGAWAAFSEKPVAAQPLVGWFGATCGACGFSYKEYHAHIIPCPLCELRKTKRLLNNEKAISHRYYLDWKKLEQQLMEVRKDVERYEWLSNEFCDGHAGHPLLDNAIDFDATIDAAIAQEKG